MTLIKKVLEDNFNNAKFSVLGRQSTGGSVSATDVITLSSENGTVKFTLNEESIKLPRDLEEAQLYTSKLNREVAPFLQRVVDGYTNLQASNDPQATWDGLVSKILPEGSIDKGPTEGSKTPQGTETPKDTQTPLSEAPSGSETPSSNASEGNPDVMSQFQQPKTNSESVKQDLSIEDFNSAVEKSKKDPSPFKLNSYVKDTGNNELTTENFSLPSLEKNKEAVKVLEQATTPLKREEIDNRSKSVGKNWNFGTMKGNSLVIHHTAGRGTVEGVIQTFKDRNFPAHFIIDRKGKITQVLGDNQKGQHTRPSEINNITNSNSWGVEVIALDDKDILPVQVDAAMRLAKYLNKTYGMPMDRVFGHGEINSHKRKTEGATIISALRKMK